MYHLNRQNNKKTQNTKCKLSMKYHPKRSQIIVRNSFLGFYVLGFYKVSKYSNVVAKISRGGLTFYLSISFSFFFPSKKKKKKRERVIPFQPSSQETLSSSQLTFHGILHSLLAKPPKNETSFFFFWDFFS